MTDPSKDLLVTSEGVDEGSDASTAEAAGRAPSSSASPAVASTQETGAPHDESGAAPPLDMESPQSRAARDAVGTGQQLEVGEG